MTESAIEKWIKELVRKEFQNEINCRGVATRSFVVARIQDYVQNLELVSRVKPLCNSGCKCKEEKAEPVKWEEFRPLPKIKKKSKWWTAWPESEINYLEEQLNQFIERQGRIQKRTSGSVKAKVKLILENEGTGQITT